MKGPLYLEYLQNRRSGWKIFVYALVFSFLAALVTSDNAGLVVIFIVVPSLCGMLGIGTFSEEIAGGTLRFLFSLPIPRRQLFKVKVISGLVGSVGVAMIGVVGLALAQLLVPPSGAGWGLPNELTPASLLFAVAYGLLAFSTGLFAVVFCREPKAAGWVNQLITWILFFYFGVMLTFSLPLGWLSGLALVAALILWIGGFLLFERRNPFDQTAERGLIGIASLSVLALVLGAVGVFAVFFGLGPLAIQPGLNEFSPAPDGKSVWVLYRRGQTLESLLLDASGNPLLTLDQDQVNEYLRPIWSESKTWLVLDHAPVPSLGRANFPVGEPHFFEVVDLNARRSWRSPVKDLLLGSYRAYLGWTRDGHLVVAGRPAVGDPDRFPVERADLEIWRVDLESGALGQHGLKGADKPPILAQDDRLMVAQVSRSGLEVEWHDWTSPASEKLSFAPAPVDWELTPDGARLVVIRRSNSSYVVELFNVHTAERKVLLAEGELPFPARSTRDFLNSPELMRIEGTSVVRVFGEDRAWLIDIETGHRLNFGEKSENGLVLANGMFLASPSGRRAAFLTFDEAGEELQILEITEEGLRWSARTRLQDIQQPVWLGEDRLLFSRFDMENARNDLWQYEVATGLQRRFYPQGND